MKKISSRVTVFHKKIFPALWFGFLFLFVIVFSVSGASGKEPIVLVVPAAMALFGFVLMKKLVWDLADEVYDGGDFLLVRNRGDEERVALSNVMNVSVTMLVNPPRITLRLVTPGKFGSEIVFSPAARLRLNPFAKNEIGEDLIVRVDRARSQRAR